MNPYLKCLISFSLGGLCIYLGSTMMDTDQKLVMYFLYLVGVVNIYIGVKDLAFILKSKK